MSLRIVTDSTCDLPAETLVLFGVRVVPLYINVGTQGYRDGIDLTREAFYRGLPTFPAHPTTAVPSAHTFQELYESLAAEGATAVLSIHIATALSGVVDVARSAAREVTALPVTVLDSQQLSLGTGFLVETAAKLAAAGQPLSEILDMLGEQIRRTRVFAALDTLEYLRRSGRMNGVMAGIGTLLQLKPLLTMVAGKPGTERVRTRRRAIRRLIEMLGAVGPLERVAIVHTAALDRVSELRAEAAALLPMGDILTVDITPVIGAHIGPGAVGFAVVGARKMISSE